MATTGNFHNFPAPDGRNDLGYGRTSAKFHKHRQSGGTYPYVEEDGYEEIDEEEIDMDFEDFTKLQSKVRRIVKKMDPGSKRGTTPFYFAGGATKMSEVALGVKNPTQAIDSFRNDAGSFRGTGSPSATGMKSTTRPTGTKRGWSAAPDVLSDEDEMPRDRLEDFIDDDGEILRQFVRRTIFNKET